MRNPLLYYMIVWKPLSSTTWTPVDRSFESLHEFCATNYSPDLLRVRKVCQYLNGLEHKVWMEGLKAWDMAVFRVATITIAETEDVTEPTGERIRL